MSCFCLAQALSFDHRRSSIQNLDGILSLIAWLTGDLTDGRWSHLLWQIFEIRVHPKIVFDKYFFSIVAGGDLKMDLNLSGGGHLMCVLILLTSIHGIWQLGGDSDTTRRLAQVFIDEMAGYWAIIDWYLSPSSTICATVHAFCYGVVLSGEPSLSTIRRGLKDEGW